VDNLPGASASFCLRFQSEALLKLSAAEAVEADRKFTDSVRFLEQNSAVPLISTVCCSKALAVSGCLDQVVLEVKQGFRTAVQVLFAVDKPSPDCSIRKLISEVGRRALICRLDVSRHGCAAGRA